MEEDALVPGSQTPPGEGWGWHLAEEGAWQEPRAVFTRNVR